MMEDLTIVEEALLYSLETDNDYVDRAVDAMTAQEREATQSAALRLLVALAAAGPVWWDE